MRTTTIRRYINAAAAVALLSCGGCTSRNSPEETPLSLAAQLGEKIFSDPSLSVSGVQSCAGCHDPAHGHASADTRAVPLGGPGMDQAGFRNAPSLRYLSFNPGFAFDADDAPSGGFDRDGRTPSLAAQARAPLLAAHEMANGTAENLAEKLRRAYYAAEFRAVFGDSALDDADAVLAYATQALEAFELQSAAFQPFDSKYDLFLADRARLSAQELRGLRLFEDPLKGNCAACHPSRPGDHGEPPLFTDFSYDNLGVPRNAAIPANADADYFDLGLCGPQRADLAARTGLCGAFKVPTLRNVALTAPYFHNGRFQTLEQAVSFYVRRDTHPQEWYSLDADGQPVKFDDLPSAYRGNVNTEEVPYKRMAGDEPALSADEIVDVIAFLKTLTDGYRP